MPAQPSGPDTESAAASADPNPPSAQEQHRRAAKQAQKDRVNRFLAEVDQSISDGDQHVAFKISRPSSFSDPGSLREKHN